MTDSSLGVLLSVLLPFLPATELISLYMAQTLLDDTSLLVIVFGFFPFLGDYVILVTLIILYLRRLSTYASKAKPIYQI